MLATNSTQIDHQSIENEFYPRLILASTTQVIHQVAFNDNGVFNFSVTRIGKYKDYGATYLLDRYTKHLSRVAEPHDFAIGKN